MSQYLKWSQQIYISVTCNFHRYRKENVRIFDLEIYYKLWSTLIHETSNRNHPTKLSHINSPWNNVPFLFFFFCGLLSSSELVKISDDWFSVETNFSLLLLRDVLLVFPRHNTSHTHRCIYFCRLVRIYKRTISSNLWMAAACYDNFSILGNVYVWGNGNL